MVEDVQALRERFRGIQSKLTDVEIEAEELKSKRDALNAEAKKLSEKIKHLMSEYEKLQEEKNVVESTGYLETIRKLSEEKARKLREVEELRRQIRELLAKVEKSGAQREREELRGKLKAHAKLEEELKALSARIEELVGKHVSMKGVVESKKARATQLKEEMKELAKRRAFARRKADEYHSLYLEKMREVLKLKDELEKTRVLLKAAKIAEELREKEISKEN